MMKLYGNTFYGNEASDYAKKNGYLDYATLAKAFDAVLNNDIMNITEINGIGYWDQESGMIDNSDEIQELRNKKDDLEYQMLALDGESEEWKRLDKERDDLDEKIDELEGEQENQSEIFQYFIVSDNGAEILKEVNEIVFYNEALDMYLWGVTHWGTGWDYVLTDIKLNCGEDAWKQEKIWLENLKK